MSEIPYFNVGTFGFSILLPLLLQKINNNNNNTSNSNNQIKESSLSCTVSAPGKILVAGGYLVLEKPNVGVTISATARFYTTIILDKIQNNSNPTTLKIVIESPQFGSEYLYEITTNNKLTSLSDISNPFVEKCLSMTLSYIRQHLGYSQFHDLISSFISIGQLKIILRADNDFYSQMSELSKRNLPYLSNSLHQLPKFLNCPRDSEGNAIVAKTGMGSSAALTTSLVGALLKFFGVIQLTQNNNNNNLDIDHQRVHYLSQLIHAVAQGKIGSGFDVSAAVFGSQVYQRFSDTKIPFDEIMNPNSDGTILYNTVENKSLWDEQVIPFNLPDGIEVMMGDVCGGSSSSSMAKAVLNWKKQDPENANIIWNRLGQTNETISRLFIELSRISLSDKKNIYNEIREIASNLKSSEWPFVNCPTIDHQEILNLFIQLKENFILCRQDLKLMGECANTNIEPDEQTILANKTSDINGVLCSGVPGAGGIDAIYAIVLSKKSRENVELMWSTWGLSDDTIELSKGCRICPLMLTSDNGNIVGVQLVQDTFFT